MPTLIIILAFVILAGAGIATVMHRARPPREYLKATTEALFYNPVEGYRNLAEAIAAVAPSSGAASREISQAVFEVSGKFRPQGVTPAVVLGIIEAESDFRPAARGRHGELGLMQLRLERRAEFTHVRPNIEHGVAYLASLHGHMVAAGIEGRDEFHASLIAYNAGPSTLSPAGRKISLRHYVKVRKAIARWRAKGY